MADLIVGYGWVVAGSYVANEQDAFPDRVTRHVGFSARVRNEITLPNCFGVDGLAVDASDQMCALIVEDDAPLSGSETYTVRRYTGFSTSLVDTFDPAQAIGNKIPRSIAVDTNGRCVIGYSSSSALQDAVLRTYDWDGTQFGGDVTLSDSYQQNRGLSWNEDDTEWFFIDTENPPPSNPGGRGNAALRVNTAGTVQQRWDLAGFGPMDCQYVNSSTWLISYFNREPAVAERNQGLLPWCAIEWWDGFDGNLVHQIRTPLATRACSVIGSGALEIASSR